MDIAFLGLGLMGARMAAQLIARNFNVTVWNRTPLKAGALASAGARVAPTPASAVEKVSVICLCLADAAAVEQVVCGTDGIARNARDAIILDFSTIGVDATVRIAGALHGERRLAWVDAPVSGGTRAAEQGSLVVFCGGEADHVAQVRPVIEAVASRYTHMGPLGAGQATKLCNQLIVSANLLAIAEAMTLGRHLGVDVTQLPDALQGGFADSIPLQIFGRKMVAADPGPVLGKLRTMRKDVEAVRSAAPALCVPLVDAITARYRAAIESGMGDEDLSALIRLYH